MRALRMVAPDAHLEWTTLEEPGRGPWDLMVRVLRAGICGTDPQTLDWDASAQDICDTIPFTSGHEFYGEAVEIGGEVTYVQMEDRICGEGHMVCGTSRDCRAGQRQMRIRTCSMGVHRDMAFAEYLTVPHRNVRVHEHHSGADLIAPELGTVFDLRGNAVHTALKSPLVGEDVLYTGADGIGQLVAVARHAGACYITITDISPERLVMAVSRARSTSPASSPGRASTESPRRPGAWEWC